MKTKKTLRDIPPHSRIFLRADLNVPITKDHITDTYKIESIIPTLTYLLSQSPTRIVIGTHIGRPKDRSNAHEICTISKVINNLLKVNFVVKEINCLGSEKYVLLQNLRYYKEEEDGYGTFFKDNFDFIVVDAFGVMHRKVRSIVDTGLITVAGLLVVKEVEAVDNIKKVGVCLVGGKKEDKLKMIEKLSEGICVMVMGALGATICLSKNGSRDENCFDCDFKNSRNDDLKIENDKKILKEYKSFEIKNNIILPLDFLVEAETGVIYEIDSNEITRDKNIVDIGPKTIILLKKQLKTTIVCFGMDHQEYSKNQGLKMVPKNC